MMINFTLGIFILVIWCLPVTIKGDVQKNTFDLHKSLLEYYDADVIPRKNSEIIHVNIKFHLMSLLCFDATEETLITAAWLSIRWNDCSLKWDENPKYRNITETFLRQQKVWKPDLRLLNTFETHRTLGSDDLLVKVKQTGNVLWEPGHRFKTSCSLDISLYPFDRQRCFLEFSTWMHLADVVKIFSLYDEILFDEFEENGEWKIVSTRSESGYVPGEGYLPLFTFTLTLQRRTLYYALTICVPILILAILNCLVYMLPSDSGEKISFCLTVLLAYMVYISFLSDNLPRTSKTTSYLVVYISLMICFSFLSVLNSVIVLLYWHRDNVSVGNTYTDDHDWKCIASACRMCSRRNGSTTANENTQTLHEAITTAISGDRDIDRKSKNTKKLANVLDKIFCIVMIFLTLTTTIVIAALTLTSTYSAPF